jgi:glyoxylase-like metal-dependent hydrolase (beta-lactamase superfamily II)
MAQRWRRVLAPNPGPMTLDGTNTYVLREPGGRRAVVVDPGPDHPGHLTRVAEHGPVGLVLLTHGHPDHAGGAARFAELTGAPVRALDPRHRLGGEGLADGDRVEVDGLLLQVIATPGHTPDSLSFLLPADTAVLTGDTVLGRGPSVVAHPEGRLGDYLASLRRLAALAEADYELLLPGHGEPARPAAAVIDALLSHRLARLAAVADAVAAGISDPDEIVDRVYADVADPALRRPARASVLAQLDYLRGTR